MALGRGCCCTRATLEALSICVSGSERDGNPSETSERVRMAAYAALEGCLARLGPVPLPLEPVPPPGKEGPEKGPEKMPPPRETIPEKPVAHSVEYYKRVNTLPLCPWWTMPDGHWRDNKQRCRSWRLRRGRVVRADCLG